MPWFRLEDSFHSHPKVIAAGNEATGLYVRCGTYAAQHLTDGFIPEDIAVLYGASETGSRRNPGTGKPETLAETLVRTKLWRRARGGWRMPDYLDYNPSRVTVDSGRHLKAQRQARWRSRQNRDHPETSGSVSQYSGLTPVDNQKETVSARESPGQSSRSRRVSNASRDASKDGAPSPPRPEGSGAGTAPSNGTRRRASPPGSPPVPKPPWCGACDETTRQTGDPPARCPHCHPLAVAWRAIEECT